MICKSISCKSRYDVVAQTSIYLIFLKQTFATDVTCSKNGAGDRENG